MINEVVDRCYQDIGGDLDHLRGDQVAAVHDGGVLTAMRDVLEGAKTGLETIMRGFDAGVI